MALMHDARHLIDDDGRDDGQPALVPLEDLVDKAVTRALGWLAESERVTGRTGSGGSGDSGNSAGEFQPTGTASRAVFSKMLAGVLGL